MTMPHLENCNHAGDGWCLECVKQMGEDGQRLRAELERVTQERDELIKDKVDRQGCEIECLYEIRKIFEDTPGKLMQDELVAHIRAEVERLRAHRATAARERTLGR